MPRMPKCRRVCCRPTAVRFMPEGYAGEMLDLTLEELETLRLCDLEGLEQQCAADRMGVSRGTFQRMIYSARNKVAEALCNGRGIYINGGNYEFAERWCGGMATCVKCAFSDEARKNEEERKKFIMKNGTVAVTEEDGQVFQHFGHTRYFAIYNVEDGKVTSKKVVDTNGSGHSALGGFLKENGVDLLICGGIGGGAKNVLAEAGIELVSGAEGSTDAAVHAFLAGTLRDDPAAECSHHEHEECHSHAHADGECRGCSH